MPPSLWFCSLLRNQPRGHDHFGDNSLIYCAKCFQGMWTGKGGTILEVFMS